MPRQVFGIVDDDGTKVPAASIIGFDSVRVDVGLYDITFTPPFSDHPVVVATQIFNGNPTHLDNVGASGGNTNDNAVIVGITPSQVRIKVGDDQGHAQNRWFAFIAIGNDLG